MRISLFLFGLSTLVFVQGCQTMPPIKTVETVNLERFMGSWYVVASIPTFSEKDVYNGTESYRLNDDGSVETTFSFNRWFLMAPAMTLTQVRFRIEFKGWFIALVTSVCARSIGSR